MLRFAVICTVVFLPCTTFAHARAAMETSPTGELLQPVTHPRLGAGFRDSTGLAWYIQTRTDGGVIDDASFSEAAYLCQLRGGVVPPYGEMYRFSTFFGSRPVRDGFADYRVPSWFVGLTGHQFWTSTPSRSGIGRNGVPFDDMHLLDGGRGFMFAENQAHGASVLCVTLD